MKFRFVTNVDMTNTPSVINEHKNKYIGPPRDAGLTKATLVGVYVPGDDIEDSRIIPFEEWNND